MEQKSVNLFPNHVTNTTAQSRSIRFQKKICKIFSNKYIAKYFIPVRFNRLLVNLHVLAEGFSNNNQIADRLLQKIMKSGIKFQVLYRNRIILVNPDDLRLLMELGTEFNEIIEMIVGLNNFDFIFNRFLLKNKLKDCQKLIHKIIGNHLTRKSHERIDFIFDFISTKEFLKYIFNSKLVLNHTIIKEITVDLRVVMRSGLIRE
ncbi:unnamed protein product [Adineta steineri]|uniref:Uncharacterized protein n=1 Tax=Adineta steineri TaxID=433720 RepID=A0A818XN40_9BILA|nr:unnamed protein product [Adineta steineri]